MQKITPVALTTVTTLFAFSGVALAQDAAEPTSVAPQKPRALIQEIKDKRKEIKSEIKDIRKDFKKDARDLQEETKARMKVATSSDARREIKKDFRVEKKELKEERKASTTAMKAVLKVLAREHANAMGQRFGVALKQFDNLATRIQSRIDKLKTAGIDTNKAESALNIAKIAIEQARADAKVLSDLVAQINSASDAKTLRAQVETAVKKVNESVKSAHKALGEAAKVLAANARSERKTATTTKEND